MRTSFLLISAVLVLAACDDAAETTAPRSRSLVTPATAQVSPVQNASGKPVPSFTTVTTVESAQGIYGGFGNPLGWFPKGTITMTCPAGTQVIGGGYDISGAYPWDLSVYTSKPDGANGWMVTVENNGGPGSTAYLKVTAICIK